MSDHRVFGRLIAPGALYGAMAATASFTEESGPVVIEDMQLHSPLVFSEDDESGEGGRTVQVLIDDSDQPSQQNVQIFSKGIDGDWTTHVEGRLLSAARLPDAGQRVDLGSMKARLSPADVGDYYQAKADTGINLGPSFRTLNKVWAGPGEALGEVVLPESIGRNNLEVHPLILDGCFQMVGIARNMTGAEGEATYLPFGWERLWLTRRMPDRIVCHVLMGDSFQDGEESDEQPEALSAEIRIYDEEGIPNRRVERLHGQEGDTGSVAVRGGRDRRPAVRGRLEGASPGIGAAAC